MKQVTLGVVTLAMVLALPVDAGNVEVQDKVREVMMKKLQHAQKVLEGIALNDFERIVKNGDDLIDLSKQAEWRALKTPQYELHSNEFRRSAETLVKAAREKNLDGATLAYVELTMNCVRCHKYVREVRMTSSD